MHRFDFNHRRSIRYRGFDYGSAGAYFVTMCTHDREQIFGEINNGEMALNDRGIIANACWHAIPTHFPNVKTDEFVIMPDHVHGIVRITVGAARASPLRDGPQPRSVGAIVGSFKSAVTKHIHAHDPRIGPVWQRNYYERIIRDERALFTVRKYIRDNPVKWDNGTGHT